MASILVGNPDENMSRYNAAVEIISINRMETGDGHSARAESHSLILLEKGLGEDKETDLHQLMGKC